MRVRPSRRARCTQAAPSALHGMTRSMGLWQAIVVFLLSAAVLVKAGSALAAYADQIAERMRMRRTAVRKTSSTAPAKRALSWASWVKAWTV